MYLSERPKRAPETAVGGVSRPVGRTVLLLGTVSLLTDIASESTAAVLPLYLTAVLGLTPLAFGLIDGLYQGASAVVRFLGGWLADRTDQPKHVAMLGYSTSAVARIFLVPAATFGSITAVLTADRLGKGLRTAPRDAMIVSASDPRVLGRAFGVHRALDTAGAAIGPLVAFAILLWMPRDYTAVFIVSAAFGLLGVAVLGFLVPNLRPIQQAGGERRVTSARPSLRLLKSKALGRLCLVAGMLGLLTISDGFLYLALVDRDDLAAMWFPLLFVGTDLAYLALAVPLGRLADRVGRGRVFIAGHAVLLFAYFFVAGPLSGWAATAGCLLALGTYYAATDGVLAAATGSLVPAGLRGSAIATTQTVVAISRLISSLAFGWLWMMVGRETAVYVVAAMLVLATPAAWALLRRVPQLNHVA